MNKILIKIKGLLEFCQSEDCWKRSQYEIDIRILNIKRYVCAKHFRKLKKYGKSTGVLSIEY